MDLVNDRYNLGTKATIVVETSSHDLHGPVSLTFRNLVGQFNRTACNYP